VTTRRSRSRRTAVHAAAAGPRRRVERSPPHQLLPRFLGQPHDRLDFLAAMIESERFRFDVTILPNPGRQGASGLKTHDLAKVPRSGSRPSVESKVRKARYHGLRLDTDAEKAGILFLDTCRGWGFDLRHRNIEDRPSGGSMFALIRLSRSGFRKFAKRTVPSESYSPLRRFAQSMRFKKFAKRARSEQSYSPLERFARSKRF
jgi:hypothetical protein